MAQGSHPELESESEVPGSSPSFSTWAGRGLEMHSEVLRETWQAGLGAVSRRLDLACGAGESSQGFNHRTTQSCLKIIQEYANSHPSISPRRAQQVSSCSFPDRASDLPRVTQQVEEGLELRCSHPQFLSPFLLMCFLGFSIQVCALPT